MNCSVAQCLEVIGEWWTMLIVRDAFLGVRRFDDFQTRLGISRNMLDPAPRAAGRRRRASSSGRTRSARRATSTGSPTRAATCGPCSPPCASGATSTLRRRDRRSRSSIAPAATAPTSCSPARTAASTSATATSACRAPAACAQPDASAAPAPRRAIAVEPQIGLLISSARRDHGSVARAGVDRDIDRDLVFPADRPTERTRDTAASGRAAVDVLGRKPIPAANQLVALAAAAGADASRIGLVGVGAERQATIRLHARKRTLLDERPLGGLTTAEHAGEIAAARGDAGHDPTTVAAVTAAALVAAAARDQTRSQQEAEAPARGRRSAARTTCVLPHWRSMTGSRDCVRVLGRRKKATGHVDSAPRRSSRQ